MSELFDATFLDLVIGEFRDHGLGVASKESKPDNSCAQFPLMALLTVLPNCTMRGLVGLLFEIEK